MDVREALAEAYLEDGLDRLTLEGREVVMARVDRLLAILAAAGYVVVPREPTAAMLAAAMPAPHVMPWQGPVARTDYMAMLEACGDG